MHDRKAESGFTLLELLIIVTILGILAAIVFPIYNGFLARLRLSTSNDQIYRAMRTAQSNAVKDKLTWQVSFRQGPNQVEWAIHPAISGRFMPTHVEWNALSRARLDVGNTTLDCSKRSCLEAGTLWRVQFNHQGNTNGQLGRITLISDLGGRTKRCVIVSTLIGTLRLGREQVKPDQNDRYCY